MKNKRLRKGRCLICLVVVFTIIYFIGGSIVAKADNTAHGSVEQQELIAVSVGYGDTLWSIVEENYDYSGNIWSAIHEVKVINHMTGSDLMVGDVIYVPQQ